MHVGGRSCLQWVLTCAGKHEEKVSLFSFSLFVPNLFSQSERRKKKIGNWPMRRWRQQRRRRTSLTWMQATGPLKAVRRPLQNTWRENKSCCSLWHRGAFDEKRLTKKKQKTIKQKKKTGRQSLILRTARGRYSLLVVVADRSAKTQQQEKKQNRCHLSQQGSNFPH